MRLFKLIVAPSPYDLRCWWDVKHKLTHCDLKDKGNLEAILSVASCCTLTPISGHVPLLGHHDVALFLMTSMTLNCDEHR